MVMILFGLLCIVAGTALALYGVQLNNDMMARLESFFSSGVANPGTNFIIIGVVVGVIGLLLFIFGLIRRSKK